MIYSSCEEESVFSKNDEGESDADEDMTETEKKGSSDEEAVYESPTKDISNPQQP